MKKICLILVLALTLVALIACGSEAVTTTTSAEETTTAAPITDAPESPVIVHGETIEGTQYVAVQNAATFNTTKVLSAYDNTCTSSNFSTTITQNYGKYTKKTIIVTDADGQKTSFTSIPQALAALKKLGDLYGIKAELDDATKSATLRVSIITDEAIVMPSWTSLTCKAGYYVMFDFTTNLDIAYCVTVTTTEAGKKADALYVQEGITVSGVNGKDGIFTGKAKCSIPMAEGKTYYINICSNSSPYLVLASIPVTITAPKYDTPFYFPFQGAWDQIEDPDTIDTIFEMVYNCYSRIYKRWAYLGNEYTVVTIIAERLDEGKLGLRVGDKVSVNTLYDVNSLDTLSVFGHELTHAIQTGFKISYSNGWFMEAMADYGRFRFFHWANGVRSALIYTLEDDIFDFHGDGQNGDNWYGYTSAEWFMAYLDWTYPTTDKNSDGEITPDEHGLIDHIVYMAKTSKKGSLSDDPHVAGSEFNNWVKDITGLDTLEEVRVQYESKTKAGEWSFTGFRDYQDNFVVEDVYNLPDMTYTMMEALVPTAKTNPILETVIMTGDNLCKGAFVMRTGAETANVKSSPRCLFDGNLETRYQAKTSKIAKEVWGIDNELMIDLGEVKTFDTYTFSFYGINATQIVKSWEILVSEDGKTFTAIDYQIGNSKNEVSVAFDEVSARYVQIVLYEADGTSGFTRINEFMLFNQ